MAQLEVTEKPLNITEDGLIACSATSYGDRSHTEVGNTGTDLFFPQNGSFNDLNASGPKFVPRSMPPKRTGGHPLVVKIHHHPPPQTPVIHIFHPPPPPSLMMNPQFFRSGLPIRAYEYYGGTIGGGGFAEHEPMHERAYFDSTSLARDGLFEDVVQKITKQLEYYFSNANLALILC